MARTTEAEVRSILDFNPKLSVEPFIRSATVMIDRVATCARSKGWTLSDEELAILEMWYTAHLCAVRDPRYARKHTQDASATFQGKWGMGIDSTSYGQQAKAMDTSGCLAQLTASSSAEVQLYSLDSDCRYPPL